MQGLIDKLNNVKPTQYCSIQTILGWAEFLLEIEKDQIVNAYKQGCSDSILDESTDEERAEQYYNETYTNPDRDENGRIWIFYIRWGISGEKSVHDISVAHK